MKKTIIICLIIAVVLGLGSCDFLFPKGEIIVKNNHGSEYVWYVYITKTTDDYWGSDLLGSDVIAPGDSMGFELSPDEYDIWVELSDGSVGELYGIDVKKLEARVVTVDETHITLVNNARGVTQSENNSAELGTNIQGYRPGPSGQLVK